MRFEDLEYQDARQNPTISSDQDCFTGKPKLYINLENLPCLEQHKVQFVMQLYQLRDEMTKQRYVIMHNLISTWQTHIGTTSDISLCVL